MNTDMKRTMPVVGHELIVREATTVMRGAEACISAASTMNVGEAEKEAPFTVSIYFRANYPADLLKAGDRIKVTVEKID